MLKRILVTVALLIPGLSFAQGRYIARPSMLRTVKQALLQSQGTAGWTISLRGAGKTRNFMATQPAKWSSNIVMGTIYVGKNGATGLDRVKLRRIPMPFLGKAVRSTR